MSNMFVYLVRETGGQILVNIGTGAPPAPNRSQGLYLDNAGEVYAVIDGTIDHYQNGLPFDVDGRLCITTSPAVRAIQSIPFAANGSVAFASGTASYYGQGLAYSDTGTLLGDVTPDTPAPTVWGPLARDFGSTYQESQPSDVCYDALSGAWVVVKFDGYAARSLDNGSTWTALPQGLGQTNTLTVWRSVACDNNGILIACGVGGAASRSIDSGVTWTPLPQGLGNPDSITSDLQSIDSDDGTTWIAGSSNGWASISTDSGATFTAIPNQFLSNDPLFTIQYTVTAFKNNTWFIGGRLGYSSLSIDNGVTWTANVQGLNSGTNGETIADCSALGSTGIAVVTMLAGYASRTADFGATWSPMPRGLNSGDTSTGLFIDSIIGTSTFIAGGQGGYAARSTNAGTTWAPLTQYLATNPDRLSASTPLISAVGANDVGTAIIGVSTGFFSVTTDSGGTFTRLENGNGLPAAGVGSLDANAVVRSDAGNVLIIAGEGGWASRSSDQGATFTALPRGLNCTVASDYRFDLAYDGGSVFVCVGSLYASRSTDQGETWAALQPGLGGNLVDTIDSVATDRIGTWVAGSRGSVRRSTDNGDTWANVAFLVNLTSYVYGLDTDGANLWIAPLTSGAIMSSTDNGASWSQVLPNGLNCGLATEPLAVRTDRTRGTWVAVGKTGYCSRSTDNGVTWTVLPRYLGGTEGNFADVQSDFQENWLAVADNGIAYYSADDGATWTLSTPQGLNSGLVPASFRRIGVSRDIGQWTVGAGSGYLASSPPV